MGNAQRGTVNARQIFWIYFLAFALMAFSFTADAKEDTKKSATKTETKNPTVVMDVHIDGKSIGTIEIKLNSEKAPISTENFMKYVDDKFYDGTIFHRVKPEFMIQGGGMTPDMKEKKNRDPIKNEAKNGLSNKRGTIAMARTVEVDSATSQFFINVVDNTPTGGGTNLDHQSNNNYGYAVFGEVTKGMDVVDKIKGVATGSSGMHQDVPTKTVLIKSVKRK